MVLQHIVLFSFPRELSEDEAGQMRSMVASWPSEIGLMTKCRFGSDLTGARTRGYNYLLYTEFPDVATLNEYRAHPVHQRFLDWLIERDCTPLAFDYYLDGRTVLMPEGQQPTPLSQAAAVTCVAWHGEHRGPARHDGTVRRRCDHARAQEPGFLGVLVPQPPAGLEDQP